MKNRTGSIRAMVLLVLALVLTVGGPANAAGPNPVSPPQSSAFGKSLNQWMQAYWRWFLGGPPDDKVTFLPISCSTPPCTFQINANPGTAFALPLAGWLGWDLNDKLPDSWWGDPNHIFTIATLDGVRIAEPNNAYYVGPTLFDPPLPPMDNPSCPQPYTCVQYQSIGIVIKPLTPGTHKLLLHTVFVDFGPAVFDNTWVITVVPPGKK